jgi:hypothetical protein
VGATRHAAAVAPIDGDWQQRTRHWLARQYVAMAIEMKEFCGVYELVNFVFENLLFFLQLMMI